VPLILHFYFELCALLAMGGAVSVGCDRFIFTDEERPVRQLSRFASFL
jgi:hypothetical protein